MNETARCEIVNGKDISTPREYGTRCEIISLDRRANKQGDWKIVPSTAPIDTDGTGRDRDQYAITFKRSFDQKGKMVGSELVLRSPHILEALKSVVGFYPEGPIITDKKVTLSSPYYLLYYCLGDLEEYRKELNDDRDVAKLHVNLLIAAAKTQLEGVIDELKTILPYKKITFDLAWALFRPGSIVLSFEREVPEAYMVYSEGEYEKRGGDLFLIFSARNIDYTKNVFRQMERSIEIRRFSGTVDISSISVYPLSYNPEPEVIHRFLVQRGHKWFNLQKVTPKVVQCDGVCIAAGGRPDRLKKLTTFGRVVIDNRMHDIVTDKRSITPTSVVEGLSQILVALERRRDIFGIGNSVESPIDLGTDGKISDKDAMLCTAFGRGYSLDKKVWGSFDINTIRETYWSPNAFEHLILRKESKEAIVALVQAYVDSSTDDITQDLISGKGLGMIFLLHGPPGVGKTLTAETIAEHIQRPLYVVSGGELGSVAQEVERNLSRVLEIATAWKAVVLIDEADVFLQERDLTNLERNSLVAVFLRQLEYYEGLMFLTTNRASCIDEAFKSRIDIALHYPDLSQTMRTKLWESSLKSLDPETLDLDLDAVVPELGKEDMNGREIRKIIKAARLMASYYDKRLNIGHIHALMGFRMVGSLPQVTGDTSDERGTKKRRLD